MTSLLCLSLQHSPPDLVNTILGQVASATCPLFLTNLTRGVSMSEEELEFYLNFILAKDSDITETTSCNQPGDYDNEKGKIYYNVI